MSQTTSYMNRTELVEYIYKLEHNLLTIQKDFAECAKGISPCFFCKKDSECKCYDEVGCSFVWAVHD